MKILIQVLCYILFLAIFVLFECKSSSENIDSGPPVRRSGRRKRPPKFYSHERNNFPRLNGSTCKKNPKNNKVEKNLSNNNFDFLRPNAIEKVIKKNSNNNEVKKEEQDMAVQLAKVYNLLKETGYIKNEDDKNNNNLQNREDKKDE